MGALKEAEAAKVAAEEAAARIAEEEAVSKASRIATEEGAQAARVPKAEERMQATSAETLLRPQLSDSQSALGNGMSLIKEEINGVLSAARESEKAKDAAEQEEATRAAIEQAKSVAEDTIGKIEAMLERQDGAGGDAANNNGTFVQFEMENGNGGLLLENGGLQERAPRGFKKIIKWFQCTVL